MKTTEELEEIYDSEPYEWIALWKNRGVWVKITNPSFIHGCHYQLIHIKHKDVLDAYLADDKVEIKFYLPYVMCTDDTELEATWEVDDNFIENYNPELEYRLKEQDDEDDRLSSDTDTPMDNRVDADNVESELDTFTAHGFEVPSFDGEILKEVGDKLYGIARDRPIAWDKYTGARILDGTTWITTDLTPIKKHWYDDPLNFPVRLVRDTEQHTTYRWVYKREDFIKAHRQGFKLVTEGNCTLIRSMF